MDMHLKKYAPARLAQEISATSVIGQGYAIYILITFLTLGINTTEWSWRDPVLNLFPLGTAVWCVLAISVATMIMWRFIAKPTRQVFVYCLRETIYGLLAALILVTALRFFVGATLPPFIPSEETAKPGIVLNMTAGYGEEVFFRLLILPLIFFTMIKWCRYHIAVLISVVVLGLIFALLHQLGTLTPGIEWGYFATRTMMPGIVLSLLFFYRSPTFAVILHSTSHILIPFAFLNT